MVRVFILQRMRVLFKNLFIKCSLRNETFRKFAIIPGVNNHNIPECNILLDLISYHYNKKNEFFYLFMFNCPNRLVSCRVKKYKRV